MNKIYLDDYLQVEEQIKRSAKPVAQLSIGFTDKEMFEYFSSCLTENRKYSIKDVLK
jgi:hypothetical protein